LKELEGHLPAEFFSYLNKHHLQDLYRMRFWKCKSNELREELVAHWQELCLPAGVCSSMENMKWFFLNTYIRNFRKECPMWMREQCDPTHWPQRAYLTDEEERDINHGILDYNQYYCWDGPGEVCQLFRDLAVNPPNAAVKKNRVRGWLDDMIEHEQLDPNGYEHCDCGEKAAGDLLAYRNELEHDYDPAAASHSHFPVTFIDQEELAYRWALKWENEETMDDGQIPRCQKILQICELHEMICNNIFVLVDTSVDDINDRISDPDGLLPVPGDKKETGYPEGFQTLPRFLMIPYEELDERCMHGYLLGGPACQPCFQAYRAAKKASAHSTAAAIHTKISEVAHRGSLGLLPPPGFSVTDRGLHVPVATPTDLSAVPASHMKVPPGFSATDCGKHMPPAAATVLSNTPIGDTHPHPVFPAATRVMNPPGSMVDLVYGCFAADCSLMMTRPRQPLPVYMRCNRNKRLCSAMMRFYGE
jgi:hypothetical protein